MSCTWSNFEEHLRKYLSNNDEQIVEILKRKFFQTTHEFQKTEASKTVLDKCIAEAASNPDRIYVILNDLKATFKLNAQKTDKKHHPGVTKRRVEIKTLHHASSHTKPQDSSDSCTDHTSPKHSSLPLNSVDVGNDDDDVIIVDSPESPATVQPPSKVDQLSHQPKSPATPSINEKQSSKSTDGNDTDSSDVQNDHRYRMIARLEHLLVRLSQCIRELEEKELDFNELDSSNSAYLKVDILKRQYLKAWRRLCEIRNVARISGRILRRKFTYSGCQYPKVNEKIEEIVNKKKLFPDFSDVYQIVSSVNKEENLKLTGSVVKSLAREVFVDVGHLLKQRRQDDLKRDFGCHLTDDICDDDDPTYSSRELRRRLTENKRLGDTNLNKVFKHFIDLQHTVQSVVCKNEAISDVSRQRRPLDLSCKTASTSSEIYTSKEAINPSKNHKSEDSPTTSDDEVFTLSSDSDEETERNLLVLLKLSLLHHFQLVKK
ncbi:unnamed protein product [Heterobilharzia americana]|nr:unnamed protein product [Heterobilharzia americana]